jgi:hypothetical protein
VLTWSHHPSERLLAIATSDADLVKATGDSPTSEKPAKVYAVYNILQCSRARVPGAIELGSGSSRVRAASPGAAMMGKEVS